MVLEFRGTAHPPPGHSAPDVANLSAVEVGLTDLGRDGGVPMLFEHDPAQRVGRCLTSWEGRGGELRVAGIIDDPTTERTIRSGQTQGLSLGTDVVHDGKGLAVFKDQQELSVCARPRRPNCYIDTIDNKKVRNRRTFSGSGVHCLCSALSSSVDAHRPRTPAHSRTPPAHLPHTPPPRTPPARRARRARRAR
jgi:hypothetical protein